MKEPVLIDRGQMRRPFMLGKGHLDLEPNYFKYYLVGCLKDGRPYSDEGFTKEAEDMRAVLNNDASVFLPQAIKKYHDGFDPPYYGAAVISRGHGSEFVDPAINLTLYNGFSEDSGDGLWVDRNYSGSNLVTTEFVNDTASRILQNERDVLRINCYDIERWWPTLDFDSARMTFPKVVRTQIPDSP